MNLTKADNPLFSEWHTVRRTDNFRLVRGAATSADGEPLLSVGPESVSNDQDGHGLARYIVGPGSRKSLVWSALLIPRLHRRACAAHDHPFACALL
jgi:hypothetical protein